MISVDLAELHALRHQPSESSIDVVVGWDARSKARLTVEDVELDYGYAVELPQSGADAPLKGVPGQQCLTDYLRLSFAWGGFPGWATRSNYPVEEIDLLRSNLLPI